MSMTVEEARRNMIEATLNAGYMVCVDVDAVAEMLRAEEELQQYRAIGTVKGYERAIQISIENYNLCREYKAKVQEFEAIGTVSEFRELKEKATTKKPIETKRNGLTVWDCPKCGNELYSGQKFCDECGKAIADEFE